MSIPFFSTMIKKNNIVIHEDETQSYVLVMKPRHGIVVCFGDSKFSDRAWPPYTSKYKNIDEIYQKQRTKFKDFEIYKELKNIEAHAVQNKIPFEQILFVDCSSSGCVSISPVNAASSVRNAFESNIKVTDMRGNRFWPEHKNDVGIVMTNIFLDEVIGKERHEFCDLLADMI
jgi:hypothetical protein